MSMSLIIAACLLALALVPHGAHAQSCVQSPQHWSFDSSYYYQTLDFLCGPSPSDRSWQVCWGELNERITIAPPSPSASTQAILGMKQLRYTLYRDGQVVYTRAATIPAACVFPAGGSADRDGKIHLIHSPRYNAADPGAEWHVSQRRLRSDTSMCFGDGDDTITITQGWMLCGSQNFIALDYYGYGFYAYGEGGVDRITGGVGSDWIYGGGGDDVLNGRGGADLVSGDADNDNVLGDIGDDILMGGSGRDFMIDSSGTLDVHMGHSGNDCFYDLRSQAVYGHDGTDIAGSDTRAGAAIISSVEASSGWCIPQ